MRRLPATRPLLGLVELREERADRRDAAEALETPAQRLQRGDTHARVARYVPERDDQVDLRMVVRVAEREVAHPRAVGRDPVADAKRHHHRRDRTRGEHRLRHHVRRGRARRVGELVGRAPVVVVVGHVRRAYHELDRTAGQVLRDRGQVAELALDRARQGVVVQPEEREPPQPLRAKGLGRLQREQEAFEVVDAVECGHHPGERPRRRAEEPADAGPERALAQAEQEAELHEDPVHPTAGEDHPDVAPPVHHSQGSFATRRAKPPVRLDPGAPRLPAPARQLSVGSCRRIPQKGVVCNT